MRFLNTRFLSAVGLSAAVFATSLMPAEAMVPIPVQKPVQAATAPVEPVQYRDRSDMRRDRIDWRRGYHRRNGAYYYNGHRGYREARPGYRRYNGAWFPLAAFATGAIIGGAINNNNSVRYGGSHVEWCQDRYRSYRVSDNTYQPNSGPRRQCNSPY
jgi:hypothetical protein